VILPSRRSSVSASRSSIARRRGMLAWPDSLKWRFVITLREPRVKRTSRALYRELVEEDDSIEDELEVIVWVAEPDEAWIVEEEKPCPE
jgi:hypothetical protein